MRLKTVTVLIGNTDNKLTQKEWSSFCYDVSAEIFDYAAKQHFYSTSHGDSQFQNACWVFEVENLEDLKLDLAAHARRYNQDSIAVITGATAFVGPNA